MFMSKPRAEVRILRRSTKLSVELLEDRLQPGSVLTGLGFSLLGSSLPDPNAGLFVPPDHAGQVVHRPADAQDLALSADLALLTPAPAANGTSRETNAAATPGPQQVGPSPALLLTSDLAALSVSSTGVNHSTFSAPQAAPAAAPAAASTQAMPVAQPAPGGSTATSMGTFSKPQSEEQSVAPAATATPIPSANMHSLTASVITRVDPEGQGGINTAATLNWTTYVAGGHTAGADVGKAVTVDLSGNIFVTGYTDDGTTRMGFVAEYNSAGTQVAFTGFQAQDPLVNYIRSEGHGIAVDANGGVYVVGKALDALAGNTDAFILKFDAANQLMPVPGYGMALVGPYDDSGEGVTVNISSHEAMITGTFRLFSATEADIAAAKISADGTTWLWAEMYTFPGSNGSTGNAITADTGGNAYLAGSVHMIGGDNDILVVQIDTLFGLMETTYGSNSSGFFTQANPGDDTLTGIALDQNGQANVVGTLAVPGGGTNAYIAQVSMDGTSLVNHYLIPNTQTGNGIYLDPISGNPYVVASSAPDASNNVHVLVQKFDTSLNPGDSSIIKGSGMETASGVAFDPNSGNAYVVGTTTSTDLSTDGTTLVGTSDAFLSNVGSFG